ncbi:hypothetical protein [Marinobacter sp. ELB17]|uniref:hypothetical protein n=1 Tax=Marinobacter sp. ELB17 TaxID=270374 RepID=UPI0000F381D3|nr:hypothetical protein [Marinobacter sp. ELB17]EAZ98184.1 hypothetical protein MELB17_09878 [Marinobacter sp. ELB17]
MLKEYEGHKAPSIKALALTVTFYAISFSTVAAAQSAQSAQNDIRSSTVVNLCGMYQNMFFSMTQMRATDGYTDDLLGEIAASEPNPVAKQFLVNTARRVSKISGDRRVKEFLNSKELYVMPCYNAMAFSYDNPKTTADSGRRTIEQEQKAIQPRVYSQPNPDNSSSRR